MMWKGNVIIIMTQTCHTCVVLLYQYTGNLVNFPSVWFLSNRVPPPPPYTYAIITINSN